MAAMSRWNLLIIAALVVVIAGALWATVLWVPGDGAVWVWTAESGELRVPARGVSVVARWSGQRLPSHPLVAEVPAATADGARVDTSTTLRPPVGVWRLPAAPTPDEGFRRGLADIVRAEIGRIPLDCFTPGPAAAGCPADVSLEVRRAAALTLGVPEGALEVTVSPQGDAVRERLLAEIAGRLDLRRRKVLVLGLDALDWDLVLPWVQAGRMPNLKRLMDTGTWGVMNTIVPVLSPIIWTTIATGVPADIHGVLDFVETDQSTGERVPVSGRSRQVPAVWNIASALGLKVGVVGWWATWPAERVNGTFVSDRLYYTLQQGVAKATFRDDPQDLIYPPARTTEFTTLRDRAVAETDWRAVRYFMNVSEQAFDSAVAADQGMEDPIDGLRRIVSATRTYLGSGLVLAEEQPDLLMVYLEGTDTIGHLLAPYMPPPTLDVDPAEAAVYAAAVPTYFEVTDRWIGRYLEVCPLDEYAVILVSDHGFTWGKDRPRGLSGTSGPTAPLWHADDAVFVVAGAGVERRGRIEARTSVFDVAPTVAALLGIPGDPSWKGSVFPGVPSPTVAPVEWMSLAPPASYSQSGGGVAASDPEFIANLEALGYLGADGTSAGGTVGPASGEASSSPARPAPTVPAPRSESMTQGQLNNLAVIKINEKKYDEAERLLRQAIAENPEYASPHYNLRRIFMETKQYDRADEELWRAIDKGFRDPERTLDRVAADYETMRMPERADGLLTRAIDRFPEHEPFYVHLMVVRVRAGRFEDALPVGAVAAEKFPDSGPVHAFYGLAAASAGETELARREIERSLAINPDQPALRQALEELQGG
jgi:hypothetical protein